MMQTMFLATVLMTLSWVSVEADQKIGLCCLCNGCAPPAYGRGNLKINPYGQTCTDLVLSMADPSKTPVGSSSCYSQKQRFYNTCCNLSYNAVSVAQAPTPSPRSKYPKGPYPSCNLCKNGQYPRKPLTITAVMGVPGNPLCKDLYYMGLQGSITDQMCKPMQWYMQGPCGCTTSTSGQAPYNNRDLEGNEMDFEEEMDAVFELTEEMVAQMPSEEASEVEDKDGNLRA